MDYVFRYLGNKFMTEAPPAVDEQETEGDATGLDPSPAPPKVAAVAGGRGDHGTGYAMVNQADAPSCQDCGSIMIRNGACYKCPNCGSTSGCS
jgi:ribonucleoside-diphosphate reductase alpha chain